MSLLPPNYVPMTVTEDDLAIASLAWGFTLGFGWLTTWTAAKQTIAAYRRSGTRVFRNIYIWMIWGEITGQYRQGKFNNTPLVYMIADDNTLCSFVFYFCILTIWALQVQFLLQIIINRCAILLPHSKLVWRLKIGVAVLITAINISVYCIWLPARLQISEQYISTNKWWDRCEKVLYLITDAGLNIYFISIVSRNLVQNGLSKYKSLARFNMLIIGFSLSMDVLIIAMMSLPNNFVYMQFHPFAYIVKLNIEMAMAELIVKVAKAGNASSQGNNGGIIINDIGQHSSEGGTKSEPKSRFGATVLSKRDELSGQDKYGSTQAGAGAIELSEIANVEGSGADTPDSDMQHDKGIYTTREVHIEFEKASQRSENSGPSYYEGRTTKKDEEDTRPLNSNKDGSVHVWSKRDARNQPDM
ncbi:hypothetical protein SUNI508_09971 [Seiridium unicorne]|uniref:Uncharacterized protein n=1 Tax=Seiridium unicorne TaxID=138068 RepID=A0ABR2UN71_9PEZI